MIDEFSLRGIRVRFACSCGRQFYAPPRITRITGPHMGFCKLFGSQQKVLATAAIHVVRRTVPLLRRSRFESSRHGRDEFVAQQTSGQRRGNARAGLRRRADRFQRQEFTTYWARKKPPRGLGRGGRPRRLPRVDGLELGRCRRPYEARGARGAIEPVASGSCLSILHSDS